MLERFNEAVQNILAIQDEIILAFWQTFVMVGISTVVGVLLGTVLGIYLFLTGKNQLFANPAVHHVLNASVNFMRAFPFVILMIALIPLTKVIVGKSIGPVAASFVLTVSAVFYFSRLVEQNLREVPRGMIEAAESVGAKPFTIIFKVLLSECRSSMVSSITVLAISVLSYSAAAGMIGGGGLGDLAIRYGYYRFQTEFIIFIVAVLSILVILMQSIGNAIARKLDKR